MAAPRRSERPPSLRPQGPGPGRHRTPVDQWFELFVYAPLGFALDARQLFPKFVDRGRSQVVLARVIGKYAVKHGSSVAGGYVSQSQAQIAAVMQALGLLPDEGESSVDTDVEAFESDAVVFDAGPVADRRASRAGPGAPTTGTGTSPGTGGEPDATASDPATSSPAAAGRVAELAIPDYDNLSASQVVPRLGGLSNDELEAVRRYEATKRGRKTILNKIAQLQTA